MAITKTALPDIRSPLLNARDLGRALRAERRALALTQQGVAEATKLRRQTIVDLEAGRNVSIHTVFAALSALGKGLSIVNARVDLDQLQAALSDADED